MKNYQKYLKVTKKRLCTVFEVQKRTSKPGRNLVPIYFPTIKKKLKKFKINYIYFVEFDLAGKAGNHYHPDTTEIFCPLGEFDLFLEDIKTKKREHIVMKNNFESKFFKLFLIPPQTAHLVVNRRNKGQTLITLDNRSSGVKELVDYKIRY